MKTLSRIVLVGATALGLAGTAQARSDVYWSVGVGAPGVAIGVGNVPSFAMCSRPRSTWRRSRSMSHRPRTTRRRG